MPSPRRILCLVVLAAVSSAGCLDFLTGDGSSSSPTAPTPVTGNLDQLAGTWNASGTGTAPATSCGGVSYTVTPVTPTSATVAFSGTCAGNIQVSGNGSGTLSGTTLNWNAQGTVSQGGLSCPFSFTNSSATPEAGGVRVDYSGTVCGISVSGSELLRR